MLQSEGWKKYWRASGAFWRLGVWSNSKLHNKKVAFLISFSCSSLSHKALGFTWNSEGVIMEQYVEFTY